MSQTNDFSLRLAYPSTSQEGSQRWSPALSSGIYMWSVGNKSQDILAEDTVLKHFCMASPRAILVPG
jgi:hypothetical protein